MSSARACIVRLRSRTFPGTQSQNCMSSTAPSDQHSQISKSVQVTRFELQRDHHHVLIVKLHLFPHAPSHSPTESVGIQCSFGRTAVHQMYMPFTSQTTASGLLQHHHGVTRELRGHVPPPPPPPQSHRQQPFQIDTCARKQRLPSDTAPHVQCSLIPRKSQSQGARGKQTSLAKADACTVLSKHINELYHTLNGLGIAARHRGCSCTNSAACRRRVQGGEPTKMPGTSRRTNCQHFSLPFARLTSQ